MGKDKNFGVETAAMGAGDGFIRIHSLEMDAAERNSDRQGGFIIGYEVTPKEKFDEVIITVRVNSAEDARKAEWKGFLIAKSYHPSIYKETKFAFQNGEVWDVKIRWAIWRS